MSHPLRVTCVDIGSIFEQQVGIMKDDAVKVQVKNSLFGKVVASIKQSILVKRLFARLFHDNNQILHSTVISYSLV